MGLLATMITLMLALGKTSLVGNMRSVLPKINFVSAILLILVGPYSIQYGIWELQVLEDPRTVTPILESINGTVSDIQNSVQGWFNADVVLFGREFVRTEILGWPFIIINLVIIVGGFIARRRLRGGKEIEAMETEDLAANNSEIESLKAS